MLFGMHFFPHYNLLVLAARDNHIWYMTMDYELVEAVKWCRCRFWAQKVKSPGRSDRKWVGDQKSKGITHFNLIHCVAPLTLLENRWALVSVVCDWALHHQSSKWSVAW